MTLGTEPLKMNKAVSDQRALWSQIYSPGKALSLCQKKNNWLWMQIVSKAHPDMIRREDPEGFLKGLFILYVYVCA